MSEKKSPIGSETSAPAKPRKKRRKATQRKPPKPLPQWKVLLHNDDVNDILYVVATVFELTPLNLQESRQRTVEAHQSGVSLLLLTHKERAELYREQFTSKRLTVTIEPAA